MCAQKLSFIIPAYNEESNISNTIQRIIKCSPKDVDYEVIVVDHGSTDRTVEIARENGAIVIPVKGGTIAGLRNKGADLANGDILVFLDADILLTEEWRGRISDVITKYQNGERMLTGSRCGIPNNPNWIERYWFKSLEEINNKHINSGHLIISKSLFNELHGFDEDLATGEDYDISIRAKKNNIMIVEDHALKVIHEGYPDSLWTFVLREFWHGKGDAVSLQKIANSKVAVISVIFIAIHLMLLVSLVVAKVRFFAIYSFILIVVIPVGMALVKFKIKSIKPLFVNSFIYYFYLLARGASSIVGLLHINIKRRHR